MTKNQNKRVLAISLSSRGFGYAAIEGENRLVDFGNKTFYEQFKNAWLMGKAASVIKWNAPDILVLRDISAKEDSCYKRVRELHRQIIALAKERKIKVAQISGDQVRMALLNNEEATRHEMAQHLATRFPDELNLRLPLKRKSWNNEHPRMDIFDAVGLTVAFQLASVTPMHQKQCGKISHAFTNLPL
jgi:hypothetical protein